jgi:putative peptidoglycan lipid II flippase
MTGSRALSNSQIARAAIVVLVGFVASGVLGLVRTAVFSGTFGASSELDAFYAAQRIPEMLFTLVAGGALGSSFIPVFARFLAKEDNDGAWRLASATMTFSALAAALLAIILVVLAPVLVPALLVPGKGPDQQSITVTLAQIMLATTFIFSISGLIMGILNAHQMFMLPALALSMNNIGLIFGALVIARILPPSTELFLSNLTTQYEHGGGSLAINGPLWAARELGKANIYGLAAGAILGALLHLAIQLPGLPRVRAKLRPLLRWRTEGLREVLTLMGPRVLGLGIVQINFAVNIAFASTMIAGSLTALNTAWFLTFFTLGIIAQSVGTAVFPTLSALAAEGDTARFRQRLSSAMRAVLFLALPATAGLIVLGQTVIGVLFERGAWTALDTRATAWALSFYALGIAGHSLLEVLSRAFYALSDTWTPVRIGVAAIVGNIALSALFIRFIGEAGNLARGPFAGLALANTLTTLVEAAALWWLLNRRMTGINDRHVLDGAARALLAAAGMGIVVWLLVGALKDYGALITAMAGGGAGVSAFFGLALLLRIDEARTIPALLLRRLPLRRRV